MLGRSALLGFAALSQGNDFYFCILECGFLQPFLPSWALPLVKTQLANVPSWPWQPLILLWTNFPCNLLQRGCVHPKLECPWLKPSQASSRGTANCPTDFDDSMGPVSKKFRDPALPCGFWEGFEPMTEIRKLPGVSWFHSHPIPILEFHLKSLLFIVIIYNT